MIVLSSAHESTMVGSRRYYHLPVLYSKKRYGLCDQRDRKKHPFHPDEIWFAQKDTEQATQLDPLSDFNIHKTANIEAILMVVMEAFLFDIEI